MSVAYRSTCRPTVGQTIAADMSTDISTDISTDLSIDISTDISRSICRSSVGRHIDRYSADVSVDISADTRPMYRSIYVGRYVSRYIDRYVNHWLSVEYRSTVGGISVDCRVLYYNQASNILDCSQSPIFPWDRWCRLFSSTGRHLGLLMRAPVHRGGGATHEHLVLSPVSLASRDKDGGP